MSRNFVTKEDINVRVLKLKTEILDKKYREESEEWEEGAHFMLNSVIDILQEYRG